MSEQEQLAAIYDAYVARVYAYIRARVPSDHDAEDLVAETFLRALGGLRRFEERHQGALAAWLFRIAHNLVSNFHRQRRRGGPALSIEALPSPPEAPGGPEEAAEQAELRGRILDLVAGLAPRQQEVIALKYFAGLRNQEIAEILALDARTVAAYLSRGLGELQRRLGGPLAAGAWETVAEEAAPYDTAAALRQGYTGLRPAGAQAPPEGRPPALDLALRQAVPRAEAAFQARLRARLLAARPGPLARLAAWLRARLR